MPPIRSQHRFSTTSRPPSSSSSSSRPPSQASSPPSSNKTVLTPLVAAILKRHFGIKGATTNKLPIASEVLRRVRDVALPSVDEILALAHADAGAEGAKARSALKTWSIRRKQGCTSSITMKDGTVYHLWDFVLIDEGRTSKEGKEGLFRVAQVVEIALWPSGSQASPSSSSNTNKAEERLPIQVKLRFYKRQLCGDDGGENMFVDHRKLVDSDAVFVLKPQWSIAGRCNVVVSSRSATIDNEHADFWTPDVIERQCKICQAHRAQLALARSSMPTLSCLDLFCGAGGFSLGLEQTDKIKTKWAIDDDEAACRTFAAHSPEALILQQDANELLKEEHRSILPRRGEVDVIAAGPPCQGFTRATTRGKRHDGRSDLNLLICTVLSYVDLLRPRFVVIENVNGILSKQSPTASFDRNPLGYARLIVHTLQLLGYDVRIGQLQAGQFGVPQSRERVIFLATIKSTEGRAVSIAELPAPLHVFKKGSCARYPALSVDEAISDLPPFDWAKDSRSPPASSSRAYACPPRNSYQALVRRDAVTVAQHHTVTVSSINQERVAHIPPESKYNYLILDSVPRLALHGALDNRGFIDRKNWFRRLDPQGHFDTVMTSIKLQSVQGRIIHPQQNRVVTIRECARAQGFPDDVFFHAAASTSENGKAKEAHRQIGNAVPVPLAKALGEEIVKAATRDHLQTMQL
ncbi:S-adenosyl-L-methionine-dependent methyltransferase [Acaromyces ingoldii]|uniref:DNA (cytosine-5-)-methyltransferase n=1 Tax=Acaromyces ingoldii TaxID=215250 RepID=A0A316YTA3_9BASI|nr:S-adenosyl-L-methionine-dependent methyltransferase [Acaromyces ingoldii]PWN92519.1 S-adenosyl-L-methionine-dependent methyltransferase [Acaromyces ingoldii]